MSNLVSGTTIAEVAALIGDVARGNMLSALMDGRALSAGELAFHAGVSAPTTSGHLAKLTEAQILAVEKQGRHRYYRLASPSVAAALEALMSLSAEGPKRHRPTGPRDEAMRAARTCYDHLAGRLGVAIADSLVSRDWVRLADGAGLVTPEGNRFLCDFGIDLGQGAGQRSGKGAGKRAVQDLGATVVHSARPLCRTCLDWSERRPHLAGRLGAALCSHLLRKGWIDRVKDSRAIAVTPAGASGFLETFGFSPA
ncbi:ArsR/SmtB family transcription factor [Kaistia terrae]|uniref:ArsR/SmtB family transcription factor n=1 Tax=Kaistia terrae TaxID=537017 RepID=A0ABW0PYX1_9HYPH|nr:helix-turn-helix transcriptional regulator [Kaistia terrae]MCX5580377.1 helix-turn-helix transcriptional regulator [Kaistia terrae]